MPSAAFVARLDISERCADNVKKSAGQIKSLEQQWQEFWQKRHEPWKHRQVLLWWTGRSIDDLNALVETIVAASVASVDI